MLSSEDTELLCRVGAGTPMGDLMRQYWMPVIYPWEIEPDGQPKRIRVLGEDLLAWRATNGTPSFTQERCPHRGASLFYGRNEEGGLRCAYHGWKFDVTGQCVEMPNEAAASTFKGKVHITAYKGADYGGMVWVYMGPRQENPPGVPAFEWGEVPPDQRSQYRKAVYECNWMQSLEGEMDSTHVYFLHARVEREASPKFGLFHTGLSAKFHLRETDYGLMYAAEREEEDGNVYWRTTNFMFPFYGMFPGSPRSVPLSIYVPIDDAHTLHMGVNWHPTEKVAGALWPVPDLPENPGELVEGMGPMKLEQKGIFFADNDFSMDLEAKKLNSTGIPSVRLQDAAVLHSMGPIMDRTLEHLCTTDAAIIKVRRKLIAAAKLLRSHGVVPPGVDNPEWYRLRTCNVSLPRGTDWEEELADWHYARTTTYPTSDVAQSSTR
jgi:phthalate 4,5-dioxygenase oxygenase subunit